MTLLDLTALSQPAPAGRRDAPQSEIADPDQGAGFAQAVSAVESREHGWHPQADQAAIPAPETADGKAATPLLANAAPPTADAETDPPPADAIPRSQAVLSALLASDNGPPQRDGAETQPAPPPAAARVTVGSAPAASTAGQVALPPVPDQGAEPKVAVAARPDAVAVAAKPLDAQTTPQPLDTRPEPSRPAPTDGSRPDTAGTRGAAVSSADLAASTSDSASASVTPPDQETARSAETRPAPAQTDLAIKIVRPGAPSALDPAAPVTAGPGQTERSTVPPGGPASGASAGHQAATVMPTDRAVQLTAPANAQTVGAPRRPQERPHGGGDHPQSSATDVPEPVRADPPTTALAAEMRKSAPRIVSVPGGAANLAQAATGVEQAVLGQPAVPATASPAATAATMTATGGASAERAVVQQITAAIPPGTPPGRIELTLDPPELGRVDISIDVADQSLKATLTAERQTTGDLIRRHLELLNAQFREAGFDDVQLSYSGQRGGQQAPEGDAQPANRAQIDIPAPVQAPQPAITGTGPGRIDIRL